jgi:ABC-2 type transport system permease protein
VSGPAVLLRQTRLEQRAFWRTPEYAFFSFVLPVVLLLTLGVANRGDTLPGRSIEASTLFVPGIVDLSIVMIAYANLTGRLTFLRADGVLKRVRATPLPPSAYLAGHLVSTLVAALLASAVTMLLGAVVLGAAPIADGFRVVALVAGLVIGIVCFAALALLLSAFIPSGDASGAVTNATFIPVALLSGVFDPSMSLPSWITRAMDLLPVKPLAGVLQAGYDPGVRHLPTGDLAVLAVWAVAAIVAARRWFRWTPSR